MTADDYCPELLFVMTLPMGDEFRSVRSVGPTHKSPPLSFLLFAAPAVCVRGRGACTVSGIDHSPFLRCSSSSNIGCSTSLQFTSGSDATNSNRRIHWTVNKGVEKDGGPSMGTEKTKCVFVMSHTTS